MTVNNLERHTRPASREAFRRAAVIARPACLPTSSPAPCGRGVGCRGTAPAASREARRRAAAMWADPKHFPHKPCPPRRAVRGAGALPLPRGLSPSGGNCAANLLSHEQPRALRVRRGVQGHCPCREARRRAAVIARPICFPTSSPAPCGRGVGCRGTAPACHGWNGGMLAGT